MFHYINASFSDRVTGPNWLGCDNIKMMNMPESKSYIGHMKGIFILSHYFFSKVAFVHQKHTDSTAHQNMMIVKEDPLFFVDMGFVWMETENSSIR